MIAAATIREALAAFVGAGNSGYGYPVDEALAATGDYTPADYLALAQAAGVAAGLSGRQLDALRALTGAPALDLVTGPELLDLVVPPLMAVLSLSRNRERDLIWLLLACHDQASDGRVTAERIAEVLCWPEEL